jgi:hypothetical protein
MKSHNSELQTREQRVAAALRANLLKRKSQARQRAKQDAGKQER